MKKLLYMIYNVIVMISVRAVVEQCIVDSTGQVFLTCNDKEVLYSPEFSVAAYTRYQPTCMSAKYPCGGHTPMSLVQRNSCFWKNSCPVKWNGQIPILVSAVPSCIGYAASVIGMYGHRCVSKGYNCSLFTLKKPLMFCSNYNNEKL